MVAGSIGPLRSARPAWQEGLLCRPDQFICNFLQIKQFRELSPASRSLPQLSSNFQLLGTSGSAGGVGGNSHPDPALEFLSSQLHPSSHLLQAGPKWSFSSSAGSSLTLA